MLPAVLGFAAICLVVIFLLIWVLVWLGFWMMKIFYHVTMACIRHVAGILIYLYINHPKVLVTIGFIWVLIRFGTPYAVTGLRWMRGFLKKYYLRLKGQKGLEPSMCYWVRRSKCLLAGRQTFEIQGIHCSGLRYNCNTYAKEGDPAHTISGTMMDQMQALNQLSFVVTKGTKTYDSNINIEPISESGVFVIHSQLEQAGEYSISIRWNDQPIYGSPFAVKIVPGPPIISKCEVLGPIGSPGGEQHWPVCLGENANVWIQMKDEYDNFVPLSKCLHRVGVWSMPLVGIPSSPFARTHSDLARVASDEPASPSSTQPGKGGTFHTTIQKATKIKPKFQETPRGSKLIYKPGQRGSFLLQVFFDGTEVASVTLSQAINGANCFLKASPPYEPLAGARFCLQAHGRMDFRRQLSIHNYVDPELMPESLPLRLKHMQALNRLKVTINHVVSDEESVADVSEISEEGVYDITCTVRKAGEHRMVVRWNDKPVVSSPLTLTVKPDRIYPPESSLTCTHLPVLVDSQVQIEVACQDRFGNQITEGGAHQDFELCLAKRSGPQGDGDWVPCVHTIVDMNNGSYEVHFSPTEVGLFEVRLRYQNLDFHPAFVCVVDAVTKDLAKRCLEDHGITLKCLLHDEDGYAQKVYLSITNRSIFLKKFFLGVFATKLHSWRLNTQLQVLPRGSDRLIIKDERDEVEVMLGAGSLAATNPSLACCAIAATLLHSRFAKYGEQGSTFEDKRQYLTTQLNNLTKPRSSSLRVTVDRSQLEATAGQLQQLSIEDWRRPWHITFQGEPGVDCGGLKREFFTIMAYHLFLPKGEAEACTIPYHNLRSICPPSPFAMLQT